LPTADIDPFAELEPDSALDSGTNEAGLFVKSDARFIRERDARDGGHESLLLE
jgi:hypothetical protein